METEIQNQANSKLQSYLLAAAFILFVLSIVMGIFAGVATGKDEATYKNVSAIFDALNFYKTDQDRYPTEAQFNDQQVLIPFYMSSIPKPENIEGICSNFNNFKYSQQKASSFSLDFCFEKGAYGLGKGFHTVTEKSIQ